MTHAAKQALARKLATLLAFAALAFALAANTAFAAQEDENLVDPTQRADNSFIRDTTIESLVEQGTLYDGREVQVIGEVIGDCIAANDKDCSWITITVIDVEDKTSISALMPDEQTTQIDRYGKYGVTGTILQVNGVFHQACNEHDGLPDIHVTASSVIEHGVEHYDVFNLLDFVPGIIAVLAGAALMAVFYFARERTR